MEHNDDIDEGAVLKFDMNTLTNGFLINVQSIKDTFFQNVDDTTSRFSEQNNASVHTLSIVTLSLTRFTTPLEPFEEDILDRCLEVILKKGVQVFEIDVYHDHPTPEYYLPDSLLSAASSLTSMTIRGCELPQSIVDDAVVFESLKLLSLSSVPIDETDIRCLTTGCPLLEEFNLEHCYGFKRFRVLGHQNLKKIKIYSKEGIKRVEIKAPNLCYLFLNNYRGIAAPSMNLASCSKLTTFCYNGFLSERFIKSLSKFPVIEDLFLCVPSLGNKKIDFNTPNYGPLEDLIYPFLTEDSSLSKALIEIDPSKLVDTLWFVKLRKFFDKINGFENLKLVFDKNDIAIDIEELKVLQSPPYELDHVELKLEYISDLPHLVAVMDAVLWCCRPRCLTFKWSLIKPETLTHVVEYIYEKLRQQEDQERINIRFVVYQLYKFMSFTIPDMKSLLEALTKDFLISRVSFIKEEVSSKKTEEEEPEEDD